MARRAYITQAYPIRRERRGRKGQHVLSSRANDHIPDWPDAPAGGGTLLLDWQDGDGINPTVWGGAPLTADGAPVAGGRTLPWVDASGTRLAQTTFATGENYTSTEPLLDPNGRDIVGCAVFTPLASGALARIISTYGGAGLGIVGWAICITNGTDVVLRAVSTLPAR